MAQQAYCTTADLEARYTAERVAQVFSVQAADGTTAGTADSSAVTAACADASAWVAQFLIGVHASQMPFATVPDVVKMYACDVAMFFGMRRRPNNLGKKIEEIPYGHEFLLARDGLKMVREGLLRIDKDSSPANAGGMVATQLPMDLRPAGTFITDPTTGSGGFEGGTF